MRTILWVVYPLVFIGLFGWAIWMFSEKTKRMKSMQSDLAEKISNKFNLDPQDIVSLGRAHNLSPANSRTVLCKVYKDIKDPEAFASLKKLLTEVETAEPFDTMPDEVKPTLISLSNIINKDNSPENKHILTPITNILTKYIELVEEQKKVKKQTYIAYIITIFSFFVGVLGLYYAFSAPSAIEIAEQLNTIELNK